MVDIKTKGKHEVSLLLLLSLPKASSETHLPCQEPERRFKGVLGYEVIH